jgi:predicted PurR-regulated permease PerM
MLIVGVLLGLGLFLIGSPLALTLALLAGLLNFVPYIGALAGAIPAILVALANSPSLAMWVAVLFISVQLLEGNVIAPWIQKRTISLPPALTILSQTVLGTLFGLIGLIVATPLIAVLLVATRMVYVEGFLEREHKQAA